MQRYYFDYAATTPLIAEVKADMTRILNEVYGNPSSIHHHGRQAKNEVEDARKKIADLINASLGEVFFSSGATETNNTVLRRSISDLSVQRIISSPTEHHCITHTLDHLQKHYPIQVEYLAVDQNGNIDLDQLRDSLAESDAKTLVSLMHANNEIGTIHPIAQISEICQEYQAYFHCDAAQTFGKIDLDLQKVHVDFLSASAHKIYGPKGIGLMYINENLSIDPLFHGGAQERNMRSGTENIIGIVGFGTASEMAHKEMQHRHDQINALRKKLLSALRDTDTNLSLNGNEEENCLVNIISMNLPKTPKTDLLVFNLDIAGISASAGSACSSGVEQASHVLQAIKPGNTSNSLRISLSHLSTEEEVDFLIKTLKSFY